MGKHRARLAGPTWKQAALFEILNGVVRVSYTEVVSFALKFRGGGAWALGVSGQRTRRQSSRPVGVRTHTQGITRRPIVAGAQESWETPSWRQSSNERTHPATIDHGEGTLASILQSFKMWLIQLTLYNNSLIALTNCVRATMEAGAHSRGSCRDPDKRCWFGQWCRDGERMDHVLEDLQEN